MRVNRVELLQELDSVRHGLSPRKIVEQSDCFVFQEGFVHSFNDEIYCRQKTLLKDVTGAVQAKPLLTILDKLPEEEIEVEMGEGELVIRGKNRRAGITMEKEIYLPIDKVEEPSKWKKLPEDFAEAVRIASQCAGKDQKTFHLTCLHIHPKWIEACDDKQLSRYTITTNVKASLLVRSASIAPLPGLEMTEFAETDTWIHFRNASGIMLCCRRYLHEYPELGQFLEVKGQASTLPKGLAEAAERAETFSAEDLDHNEVRVELKPGKVRIWGEGSAGYFTELKGIKYDGPSMSFTITPKLLAELSNRFNECVISPTKLKVESTKFVYVACLGMPKDNQDEETPVE